MKALLQRSDSHHSTQRTRPESSTETWPLAARAAAKASSEPHPSQRPAHSPADVVCLAGVLQIQAVGLVSFFIGAHRNDRLSAPLSAGNVPAGAEEHSVAVLGRDLVKELPEGLVALAAVADLIGHAGGARRDVGRPVLLAGIIQVAGLGCIQAVVPFGNVLHCNAERGEREQCFEYICTEVSPFTWPRTPSRIQGVSNLVT